MNVFSQLLGRFVIRLEHNARYQVSAEYNLTMILAVLVVGVSLALLGGGLYRLVESIATVVGGLSVSHIP